METVYLLTALLRHFDLRGENNAAVTVKVASDRRDCSPLSPPALPTGGAQWFLPGQPDATDEMAWARRVDHDNDSGLGGRQ